MAQVDIVIKGTDNLSSTLKNIQKNQTAYRKDLESLDKELQELTQNHGNLAAELTRAKKSLSDAQKQFRATGDEADALNVSLKQMDVDNIQKNMRAVSNAMRSTERDMQSLTSSAQKMDNQLASTGTSGASGMGGLAGAMQSLASAGIGNLLGSGLGALGGTIASSMFGGTYGGAVTSTLSSAATGAAMGSILGPVGTAIGGLVGAISGAMEGLSAIQQERDDAFRTAVSDTYSEVTDAQQQSLTSGTETAARREIDALSFATLFGSSNVADAFLGAARDMAAETPFEYADLTQMSRQLATYGYDPNEILRMMPVIGDAGAALGLEGYDMSAIATYLGRMNSSDKTTLEYLNPLIERGIPAIDYLAEALGDENGPLAAGDVYDMISKGEISGKEAAQIITDAMAEAFDGAMEEQAKTYSGLMSTLEDNQTDIDAAMGEGYTEERKKGLEEQIAWMEGASGESLKEANRLIGVYQASLENEQERLYREAMDAALEQIEDQGITNEAEAGRILAEAQAKAKADYIQSDAYQMELAQQEALVNNLQTELLPVYEDMGYSLGQVMATGVLDAMRDVYGTSAVQTPADTMAAGLKWPTVAAESGGVEVLPPSALTSGQNAPSVKGYAVGLPYVPYDDFPALLHEGERVLTRSEAAAYDAGGGGIQIVVNGLSVREEADVSRIAQELARQLALTARSYTG